MKQTRYAGPMVLKHLTQEQVGILRRAIHTEGSKIVQLGLRVTAEDGGVESLFNVWLGAKAEEKISVCMWAKQLGLQCVQMEDVFSGGTCNEGDTKRSAVFQAAMNEAKKQSGCEFFENSRKNNVVPSKSQTQNTGSKPEKVCTDMPNETTPALTQPPVVAPPPPQRVPVDPKNVNESLWLWLDNQRHFPDGVELWSRTPKEVWAFFKTCIPGWSEWKKGAKMCPTTYVPTFAKAMQKHRMSKPEWKAYSKERLEHATVPASAVEPKPQEKVEESAAPCKRQKCANGDVSGAPRVAQGDEGGSKARIDEPLLRYLTDQRRFDDGEELSSKAPEEVWMQLQSYADRWYTSKKQEPCQDTHRPTLVKAMRTHEMSTKQWRAYALSRL